MIRGALLVAAALATLPAASARAADDPWPGVAAAYVVRIDGATRWASHASARLRPASLTKLMTAVLVVEALAPGDVVVVSRRAAAADGVRLGLQAGMKVQAEQLLAAALLRSANDACLALAERVAGSEAPFVAAMNARAAALGLADTHFTNACGFDAPGHHASAQDLAVLADAALALPRLAAIVARESGEATTTSGRTFRFDNTNVLVGRVEGARGVKTGWTLAAGRCLIALAERGGTRVMVVLLGAPDRWWDAVAMIESAFDEARARPAPRGSRPP